MSDKVRSLLSVWHSIMAATDEGIIASIETASRFAPLSDFPAPLAIAPSKVVLGRPDFLAIATSAASRGLVFGSAPCTMQIYELTPDRLEALHTLGDCSYLLHQSRALLRFPSLRWFLAFRICFSSSRDHPHLPLLYRALS